MWGRVSRYLRRLRDELGRALTEEHTPKDIARSYAIGTFITMLPTLGVGLLVFVVLDRLFESINRVALFANVLVYNPVVKWGVYAISLVIGFALLGPVEGASIWSTPTLADGQAILVRMLVGTVLLTIVVTLVSYRVVLSLARKYEHHEFPVLEETVEEFVEQTEARERRQKQRANGDTD